MLSIHSPSRVAAEIGGFFTIGPADGIENEEDRAVAAAAALAEQISETMADELSPYMELDYSEMNELGSKSHWVCAKPYRF